MGEIIDLESYRRQHKRRPVETNTVEANAAANRRGRNRGRFDHDRVRPAIEPLDRVGADSEAKTEATAPEPGDKRTD